MNIANMMSRVVAASLLLATLSLASVSVAQTAANIVVEDPWAGTTNAGATVAAGYLTLHNRGERTDRLLAAQTARASRVELHEMTMDNSVMRMRMVDGIAIPPRGAAVLRPGGLHLMFIDIDAPFVEGQRIPVTLTFERAGIVQAEFVVRPRHRPGGPQHEH